MLSIEFQIFLNGLWLAFDELPLMDRSWDEAEANGRFRLSGMSADPSAARSREAARVSALQAFQAILKDDNRESQIKRREKEREKKEKKRKDAMGEKEMGELLFCGKGDGREDERQTRSGIAHRVLPQLLPQHLDSLTKHYAPSNLPRLPDPYAHIHVPRSSTFST